MVQYVGEEFGIFSHIISRVSIALFVVRLFATTKKLRMLLYGYTAVMVLTVGITSLSRISSRGGETIGSLWCRSGAVCEYALWHNGCLKRRAGTVCLGRQARLSLMTGQVHSSSEISSKLAADEAGHDRPDNKSDIGCTLHWILKLYRADSGLAGHLAPL